jgi:hypothetical protein
LPPSPSSPPVVRGQWRRRRGRGGGGARCGRSSSCCGCCSTRPRGCSPTRKVRVSLSPVRFASSVCCAVCRCGGFVGSSPSKPWLRMAPAAGRARVACSSFPAVGPVLSNGCWVNPNPPFGFSFREGRARGSYLRVRPSKFEFASLRNRGIRQLARTSKPVLLSLRIFWRFDSPRPEFPSPPVSVPFARSVWFLPPFGFDFILLLRVISSRFFFYNQEVHCRDYGSWVFSLMC